MTNLTLAIIMETIAWAFIVYGSIIVLSGIGAFIFFMKYRNSKYTDNKAFARSSFFLNIMMSVMFPAIWRRHKGD